MSGRSSQATSLLGKEQPRLCCPSLLFVFSPKIFIWSRMSVYLSVSLQILSTALHRNVWVPSLSKSFRAFTRAPFHFDGGLCMSVYTRSFLFDSSLLAAVVVVFSSFPPYFHTLQTHIPQSIDGSLSPGDAPSLREPEAFQR